MSKNLLFTDKQIGALRTEFEKFDKIDPSCKSYQTFIKMMDVMPQSMIKQLANAQPKIKFISALARNRVK